MLAVALVPLLVATERSEVVPSDELTFSTQGRPPDVTPSV